MEETKTRERSRSREKTAGGNAFGADDQVALKMRGVPYRASQEEIEEFFTDYGCTEVKIEVGEDGRKTGFAAALFESEDAANKAREEKDRQTIGTRWIGLSNMSYGDF